MTQNAMMAIVMKRIAMVTDTGVWGTMSLGTRLRLCFMTVTIPLLVLLESILPMPNCGCGEGIDMAVCSDH